MRPGVALAGLVVAIGLGAGAVAVSQRADPAVVSADEPSPKAAADLPVQTSSAPAVLASGWLNTEPLRAADLRNKVVLYDFWTLGCSNCRATLPYVEAWQERYAPDGLVILSIHTPEFDYEHDPDTVAAFVRKEGLTYPVALDPDQRTWDAFDNHYWPAFYLHDREGRRRLTHFGEGTYDQTEDAIRVLLGVDPASPRASVEP